jgi:pterin-4a-carbinolamine dehydratase
MASLSSPLGGDAKASTDDITTSVDAVSTEWVSVCRPCSGMDKSDVLDVEVVRQRAVEMIPLWSIGTKEGSEIATTARSVTSIPYIHRTFVAKNFQAALDCIIAMGAIAEAESHHPNFHLVNYREVCVEIWTHKLNGLTENDLLLAQRLDQDVKIAYSPLWLKQHPEAKTTAKDE